MVDEIVKHSQLTPSDRAAFACASRLLSALVTESLLRAFYFPLDGHDSTGYSVFLNNDASLDTGRDSFTGKDIFAVALLQHPPLFRHDASSKRFREIGLLDPLDIAPLIFDLDYDGKAPLEEEYANLKQTLLAELSEHHWQIDPQTRLTISRSTVTLWEKYGRSINLDSKLLMAISEEISSSEKWQRHSYENPRPAPQFGQPSIVWEQSIIEGFAAHYLHKLRSFLPPIPNYAPGQYDLHRPNLRLISVPRSELYINNDFEGYIKPLLEAMSKKAGQGLEIPENHVAIPVHELQLNHIQDKFENAVVYPEEFSLPVLAQQSIRSVVVPTVYRDLSLKLSIGLKLTSTVRTIFPASARFGPCFGKDVVPALTMDRDIVTVARELASVAHAHPEKHTAKHCAAIVRECHENMSEERGERLIVCTALVESGHSGEGGDVPVVIRVFELDTEQKRINWLTRFVRMLLDAFLPPLLVNGVAFECHPQNCVARFDIETKELKGFVIRDTGGICIHRDTLKASTGVDLDYDEDHDFIITRDFEPVDCRVYVTLFHNHLQRLIRVLGLHYNGIGWQIVREHLEAIIPKDHRLYTTWLSPESKMLPGKAYLRTRLTGKDKPFLREPLPNIILYRGVEV